MKEIRPRSCLTIYVALGIYTFYCFNALPNVNAIFETVELTNIVVRSFETKDIIARFADPFNDNKPLEEGKTYQIESRIVPVRENVLHITYVVQIKDSSTSFTEQLTWFSAEVPYSQNANVSQSWIPMRSGKYLIEVSVWEDLEDAIPLAKIYEFEVVV